LKSWLLILFLPVGLGVLGWLTLGKRPAEPVYRNVPLTIWLSRLAGSRIGAPATNSEAAIAVRAIGPEAVPLLVEMVDRQDRSFFDDLLDRWSAAVSIPRKFSITTNEIVRLNGAYGLNVLGATADPAFATLTNLLQNSHSAAIALAGSEPQGVSYLVAATKNDLLAESAAYGLGFTRSKTEVITSTLLQLLQTHTNSEVRFAAANSLGLLHSRAEESVPGLIVSLSDTSRRVRAVSAAALAAFGPAANTAIPALQKLTQDSDRFASYAATRTLQILTGETDKRKNENRLKLW
jgi:hypothetical protein